MGNAFTSLVTTAVLLAGGVLSLPLSAAPPAQAQAAPTSWLDRSKPVNWNKPGMAVPGAPAGQGLETNLGRCGETLRPATAPEDQALTRAGWRLFGPYQRFGNTVLVQGLAGFDGMCRPMRYQGFVFVNGQFAGTLAPQPMDARTDGSSQPVTLFRPSQINASFSRYTASDALCCPSSTSFVTYELQRQGDRPLLVPMTVTTSPNKP